MTPGLTKVDLALVSLEGGRLVGAPRQVATLRRAAWRLQDRHPAVATIGGVRVEMTLGASLRSLFSLFDGPSQAKPTP
ncbi:MAG TPA: hypothetical protein VGV37_12750 [Aliidongia sp.]|uniref:hypothetical protein n=1 Tax=Aliidongia sp. TaxID=1914230 RepID=UPI002DDD37AD|nr:hypothetical protein [Aliidongia sp.]HEV2675404.1 hypothetical protein [Aliidongia sp.]